MNKPEIHYLVLKEHVSFVAHRFDLHVKPWPKGVYNDHGEYRIEISNGQENLDSMIESGDWVFKDRNGRRFLLPNDFVVSNFRGAGHVAPWDTGTVAVPLELETAPEPDIK